MKKETLLIVLTVSLVVVGSACGGGAPGPTATPKSTNTSKPTDTPAPTATPKPTNTLKPTNTPSPTDTPTPTKAPVAIPTEVPASTLVPRIIVVSPNGGEEWTEGKTYRIIWSSVGIESVNIQVRSGGKDKGHIAFEVEAELREYAWTIPQRFISGFGVSKSDAMRVRISDASDPGLYDENDEYFTVAAP